MIEYHYLTSIFDFFQNQPWKLVKSWNYLFSSKGGGEFTVRMGVLSRLVYSQLVELTGDRFMVSKSEFL